MKNYAPLDVVFTRGQGCWLTDDKGRRYLDALSGVGVMNLGHCHPNITKAIQAQSEILVHTSNWYHIEFAERLADKLCQLAKMDSVFFANSGAEANETAIKITRLYGRKRNIENPIILTAKQSFHGRTMATLSATGTSKIKTGFAPLVADFIHVDFDDVPALEKHTKNPNIVALMLEPILGEHGVIIPKSDYLNHARDISARANWLLILDEIQTGIGRTGRFFAFEYNQIKPDIITLAKGLGGGLPIGACLARGEAAHLFSPGAHGTTFGGNPLCARVSLSVLETIEQDNILAHVREMSNYFLTQANKHLASFAVVKDIRAKGLMLAISLDKHYETLMSKALTLGILINVTGKHIRLLPPLIIKKEELDFLLDKLNGLIGDL